MESNYNIINVFLVQLFNDIIKIEEKHLITDGFLDISVTDMHVIEKIGYETAKNMTSVARELDITVGTLTIAINNLVKKGYVKRVRSIKDRRVVLISLTDKGQEAYRHHEKFHERMVDHVASTLQADELQVLEKALSKLSDFFHDLQQS